MAETYNQPQPTIEMMRAGIGNFLGQSISMMPFDGIQKNKLVVAMLVEEALKASKTEDNKPCNLEILMPMFNAIKVALEQNIRFLGNHANDENQDKILAYLEIIENIEKEFLKDTDK